MTHKIVSCNKEDHVIGVFPPVNSSTHGSGVWVYLGSHVKTLWFTRSVPGQKHGAVVHETGKPAFHSMKTSSQRNSDNTSVIWNAAALIMNLQVAGGRPHWEVRVFALERERQIYNTVLSVIEVLVLVPNIVLFIMFRGNMRRNRCCKRIKM